MMNRRKFLKQCIQYLLGLPFSIKIVDQLYAQGDKTKPDTKSEATQSYYEARYYEKTDMKNVRCRLCFRECLIENKSRGFCRNRLNVDGKLVSLVYNRPCALQVDPIEKEPMYHFLPDTQIFCVGTASCNFRCRHCHNWHISQRALEETHNYYTKPEEIVELARKHNCKTVSFTYNEPTVFFEYMCDTVKLAKAEGLKAIFHTNGALGKKPLADILKIIDGITVDLKGFTEKIYESGSSARLAPVLANLKTIKEAGVWLEIVNLIIPTKNDSINDLKKMCAWIKENLGNAVPLHFSRFFPNYKLLNVPPTPVETLEMAYKTAKEAGIEYVSIGNMPGHKNNSTFCPGCQKVLIQRTHFAVHKINIRSGCCKNCGLAIPGIWE